MSLDHCIARCHSQAEAWWKLEACRASVLNRQMCAILTTTCLIERLVQELEDALQQQQVTQQVAASAEEQAQTARRHQQEHAEENAALKHEIQVKLSLSVLVILCGRELTNTSGIPREGTAQRKHNRQVLVFTCTTQTLKSLQVFKEPPWCADCAADYSECILSCVS